MEDSNSDADSDVSASSFGEEFERCAACGDPLPRDEWCPTVTDTDEDGNLVVRTFCDEACRDEWTGNSSGE